MKRAMPFVAILGCAAWALRGVAAESAPPTTAAPQEDVDPDVAADQVSEALRTSKDVPADAVVVSTHAATVVLTGEVDSAVDAARATAVAEEAADGLRVSSQIAVRPGDDEAARRHARQLVRSVEQALQQDQRTATLGVAVSVDESHVIGLHGLVPSPESRRVAEDVAGRVAGVTRLRSHLVVPGD